MKARHAFPTLAACLALATALAAGAFAPRTACASPAVPPVMIRELPDLPKGDYVLGRDGGGSTSAFGQFVLTHGDTSLSQANEEGKSWINNSMYHTTDVNADDGIGGGCNFRLAGQPAVQWIPTTAAEAARGDRLWPQSPFKDPNTNKLYWWFGNVGIGSGFAEVTTLTLKCTRIRHRPGQSEDYLMFLSSEWSSCHNATTTNGFLYVYCEGAYASTYIARAPLASEAFKTRANWRFLSAADGSIDANWVADPAAKYNIGMGGLGTIEWNAYLNCWLVTESEWLDDRIGLRTADNPWGPFSPVRWIFTGARRADAAAPYAARAHKTLEKLNGQRQYLSYAIPMDNQTLVQRMPTFSARFFTPLASPPTGAWLYAIAKHSGKTMDVQYGSSSENANVW
jgi:hypothetical protein